MLEPQSRAVLLEALRPPDGFVVERALATTYTLDLTALLTAPLAFSLYDGLLAGDRSAARRDGPVGAVDPYALLKSVRAHAERLTVFCQATRIANPPTYRRLLGYLESSVVQVGARTDEGVFHPKIWVVRFTHESDPTQVRYRLLCLSRNLTFDRSWDTMLSLDGELTDRTNAFRENHPLGDFVAALPGLAVAPMERRRKEDVLGIADEIRRVKFELPEGFERVLFHPLGIEGYTRSPLAAERIDRLLVVSPFVSEGALAKLSVAGRGDVLVSRIDQLQALRSGSLAAFASVHVLDDAAEVDDEGATESSAPDVPIDTMVPPTGLHAKLYVADAGWNAHVWTGSANATTAAFERNVEFLVQLTGKKGLVGVTAVLDGRNDSGGLRALLGSFTPPPNPVQPSESERRLEERLRLVRAALGRVRWSAVVGRPEEGSYPFALDARGGREKIPDVEAAVWPISLQETRAQRLHPAAAGRVADFGLCSFEALTSFFAFRVRVTEGDHALLDTFVLNVPLEGAPDDRAQRILQSLLDDPAKVLRFLTILLAVDAMDVVDVLEPGESSDSTAVSGGGGSASGLLESFLRALDRDPTRIDSVDELVRDLSTTEAGRSSLPAAFMTIWEPIRAARASLSPRVRS